MLSPPLLNWISVSKYGSFTYGSFRISLTEWIISAIFPRQFEFLLASCLLYIFYFFFPRNVKHSMLILWWKINFIQSQPHSNPLDCGEKNHKGYLTAYLPREINESHGTIRTVHTTHAAALKTTTHPKTRCRKSYAAAQHPKFLMMGVCTRNMSS